MAVRASSDRSKLAADALDHGTAAAGFDVRVPFLAGDEASGEMLALADRDYCGKSGRTCATPVLHHRYVRIEFPTRTERRVSCRTRSLIRRSRLHRRHVDLSDGPSSRGHSAALHLHGRRPTMASCLMSTQPSSHIVFKSCAIVERRHLYPLLHSSSENSILTSSRYLLSGLASPIP